jgi:hypothetical protein
VRITRLEASSADDTSPSAWPAVAHVNVEPPPTPSEAWIDWRGYGPEDHHGGVCVMIPGNTAGPTPQYCYEVQLLGEEFGTLLGGMPLAAVPGVLDAFLRAADPELLGAVVGHLIAHVSRAASRRR